MLIRMDDELFDASILDSISFKQNMILRWTSFICYERIIIMTQPQIHI